MNGNLKRIKEFVDRLKSTNSTNDKIDIIKEYNGDDMIEQVLKYTYSPFKQYHVTSKTCKKNSHIIDEECGFIDLFDFNPQHQRAGIGILILNKLQNKGYATEALKVCIKYAFSQLNLHQIYANIPVDNKKSIQLFEKLNFKKIGTQKDWLQTNNSFKDVHFYQIINSN